MRERQVFEHFDQIGHRHVVVKDFGVLVELD
jgi:hypothetical protein